MKKYEFESKKNRMRMLSEGQTTAIKKAVVMAVNEKSVNKKVTRKLIAGTVKF